MGLLPTGGESPSVLEEPLPGVLHISTGQSLSQQQPAGPGPVAKSILYSLHSIQVILGTLLTGAFHTFFLVAAPAAPCSGSGGEK